jgi:hypothetical protein
MKYQPPTRTVWTNAEARASRHRRNPTGAAKQEKFLSQMAPEAPRHAVPKKQRFNFKETKRFQHNRRAYAVG